MTNGMEIAGIRMKRTSFLLFSGGSGESKILMITVSDALSFVQWYNGVVLASDSSDGLKILEQLTAPRSYNNFFFFQN